MSWLSSSDFTPNFAHFKTINCLQTKWIMTLLRLVSLPDTSLSVFIIITDQFSSFRCQSPRKYTMCNTKFQFPPQQRWNISHWGGQHWGNEPTHSRSCRKCRPRREKFAKEAFIFKASEVLQLTCWLIEFTYQMLQLYNLFYNFADSQFDNLLRIVTNADQ